MPLIEILFLLLFGHAMADFVLQPEAMGYGKNRNDKIHDMEHSLFPVWWYWLTAHSLVHGGVVYLITNSLLLGIVETVIHWITDFSKCEGWITMHQDQAIHIGCKLAYGFLIYYSLL
ncbi:MAG: DUF3307 domain-containing protein [Proteobacteria bacterium]|nr:DUF3307 domain-containing protein [Pseudomonadota bacterium]